MTNEPVVYYINPDEDLPSVRERLEQASERNITLIVPAKALLRSHVAWRVLRARARELHKEITVISPDRQIRAVAKAAGLPVAASEESPLRSRPRPGRGGIRRPAPTRTPINRGIQAPRTPAPGQLDGTADKKSDMAETSEKGATNSISSAPEGQEDDPFAYMEDDRSSSLPEQLGSAPIEEIDPGVPDISEVPADVLTDSGIEDLGDQGDIVQPNRSWTPDSDIPLVDDDLEEPDIPGSTRMYGSRPRGSRLGKLPPLPEEPVPSMPPLLKRPSGALSPEAGPRDSQPIKPPHTRDPRVVQPPPRRGTAISPTATRRQRSWGLLIALFLLGLLVLGGWIFFGGVFSSATVTITPASQDMRDSYVISAVTGTPKASQRQVQARILSYTPSSQTKIVPATGVGHVPATQAHGSLTLYNALSYSQTIAAGTVFTDATGVQVVNDRVATIPGAKPPTEGTVIVPAHTVNTGSSANVPAFDFNNAPFSIAGITVQNKMPFSGGQDSQAYSYVQQSDIDNVVSEIKKTLEQNAQTLLRMQILPGEQLVGSSIPCTVGTTSDHAAGDKAASVTVTVTDTCTGEVYDQQGARLMAENLLKSEAAKSLGAHYLLVGNLVTTVTRAPVIDKRGTISLFVNAVGRWVYQFDDRRKKELAKLITGKDKESAQALLRSVEGVSKGDIELSFFSLNSLPDDPDKITVLV